MTSRSIFRGDTLTEITSEIRLTYNIILAFLATMTIVIGVVGSVGLRDSSGDYIKRSGYTVSYRGV